MQRTLSTRLAATALIALGAIVASAGASAHTANDGYRHADPAPGHHVYPSRHPAPRVVHVRPVYVQHVPQPRYVQAGGWNGCGAPEWDPQARYMPGQVVWQDGNLYVATDLSAQVWNVNSAPVWTPTYWAQAVCQ